MSDVAKNYSLYIKMVELNARLVTWFLVAQQFSCNETTEIASADDETLIIRACKRALSGQRNQAEKLMRNTKQKWNELSVGKNVVVPVPQYDRGPIDPRNIRGIIKEVSEFGYRIGNEVGILSGYLI